MTTHYFDRSRIEVEHKCPRRQYWEYYYDGKGLQPVHLNQHLAFGGAVHEALAEILTLCKSSDALPGIESVNMRIRKACIDLRYKFEASKGFQAATILEEGFDGELVQVTQDQSWLLNHYCDLLEGLVIGWCLVRLPLLMQEYRVVEIETEERLPITDDIVFCSRPDAILERRTDGALVILSFKTTSQANTMWLENFKTDQQTISEVLPVEFRLGKECAGVQIEGLIKGKQQVEWPKGSGQWHHTSPLVWGYLKEDAGLDEDWKAQYTWVDEAGNNRRLGKGYNRQRIAERYPGGVAEWVGYLYQAENELLQSQLPSPPLVIRSAGEIDEWQEAVKCREVQVANALVQIENNHTFPHGDVDSTPLILAQVWPKHTTGCAYDTQFHSKCPCYELCWGSEGNDPIGSGRYQYRVPNHPEEQQ